MAQYPIPQFIESEGKITPFLTFKQFFLLVGGGAFCLLFYYILPFFLFVIFSIFIGLLVLAVAFLKVDNISVVTIFFNFFTFLTKSKIYMWQKKESPYPFKIKRNYETKNMQELNPPDSRRNRLYNAKKIIELRKK